MTSKLWLLLQSGGLQRQSSGHIHYSTEQIEALLKELRTVAALEVRLVSNLACPFYPVFVTS